MLFIISFRDFLGNYMIIYFVRDYFNIRNCFIYSRKFLIDIIVSIKYLFKFIDLYK